ncbi:flagellar hook protein FlgE [Motilibacter peucedani]|uniref:Flagellar hook protein FlgE n=1 Tax=Motilibacter peucedani TaxID=598650 RepID=A0A420XTP2_9ACTN|nr:flagellar hook protein FlgE [Motilibacter peucedani]RKS80127.1 flagellar hook protein FlgE [Motilibacter peucedani]
MLRSLFTGISGLKQHQTMMDVTANNIANVNSAGFKSSSTVFEDTLSQMMRSAGAPQDGIGGTNPSQVGLGVRLGGISTNFNQGSTQSTGRSTDLMIQGDGFFAIKQGSENMYTRNGSFSFDQDGRLVTSSGGLVQGWSGVNGAIDKNGAVGDIQLPTGSLLAPSATANASWKGNLPADSTDPINGKDTYYDPQGNSHEIVYSLTKGATTGTGTAADPYIDNWSVSVKIDGTDTTTPAANLALKFDKATGTLVGPAAAGTPPTQALTIATPWGKDVALNVGKLKEYGGDKTFQVEAQDGSAMGSLQSFTISPDGTLIGVFTNGLKQPLAQIATANFNNPSGLEKVGGTMFRDTVNSGTPELGAPGGSGRGALVSNSLEMSNVDLAAEFTNLIVAQRGFQANSKVITSSDEILNDLVNLKR